MLSHLREGNYYLLEVYIFLRAVGASVVSLAVSLLIQDKICLQEYKQTAHFCEHINEPMSSWAEKQARNHILADATTFGNYRSFLECIPSLVWCLFVGSFLDVYQGGARLVLCLGVLGDLAALVIYLLNVYFYSASKYYLLLGCLSVWVTGGLATWQTTIYSYIAASSSESSRSFRFMLVRFSNIMGMALGTFIGGHVIALAGATAQTPLRTYYRNIGLSLLLDLILLAVLFSLYRLTAKKPSTDEPASINSASEESPPSSPEPSSIKNIARLFFRFGHFRATVSCFFQVRPNKTRMRLQLLYLILFTQVLIFFGTNDVLLQFCEKVYHWDAKEYSNLASASKIIATVMLAVSSLFLLKRWALAEGTVILLALLSSFASEVVIGTFLRPAAYYVAIPLGCLSGLALIAIRSKLSRVVGKAEVGKILSLSSTLEAVIPFLSSFIYSNLFSLTIDTYPSLIYHFSAFIVCFSVILLIIEEFA